MRRERVFDFMSRFSRNFPGRNFLYMAQKIYGGLCGGPAHRRCWGETLYLETRPKVKSQKKRGRKPTAHGPETPPIVGEGRGWERVRLYEHRKMDNRKESKLHHKCWELGKGKSAFVRAEKERKVCTSKGKGKRKRRRIRKRRERRSRSKAKSRIQEGNKTKQKGHDLGGV